MSFYSCTDENRGKLEPKVKNLVSRKIFNATFSIKDSGYQKLILRSPLVEMYEFIDTPYTIFPKGLNLNFYKKNNPTPGFLRASFAKFIEKKGLYEAKGNVIFINPEGDTLKTQHLYWNKITRFVYSNDTVKINRKDSSFVTATNGLEATEDLKTFTLFNNKGAVMVKNQ